MLGEEAKADSLKHTHSNNTHTLSVFLLSVWTGNVNYIQYIH